jgi:hypothetical protein
METFAIIGFVFGMSALSIGIISKGQIENLKIEVDELKEDLKKLTNQTTEK